jgi:hypothetical protein
MPVVLLVCGPAHSYSKRMLRPIWPVAPKTCNKRVCSRVKHVDRHGICRLLIVVMETAVLLWHAVLLSSKSLPEHLVCHAASRLQKLICSVSRNFGTHESHNRVACCLCGMLLVACCLWHAAHKRVLRTTAASLKVLCLTGSPQVRLFPCSAKNAVPAWVCRFLATRCCASLQPWSCERTSWQIGAAAGEQQQV